MKHILRNAPVFLLIICMVVMPSTACSSSGDSTGNESESASESSAKTITAVYPAEGEEVCLANDEVAAWCSEYEYGKTTPYYRNADVFYPKSLTLSWSVDGTADSYRVTLSRYLDLSEPAHYEVSTPEVTIKDLFVNTTYYWQIEAVCADKTVSSLVYSFRTADTPRTISVEGVTNTRDIGGAAAVAGYRLKQGMIYRTAKLDDITDEGKDYLVNELGIKTDLDLRKLGEGDVGVSPLGDSVNYINISGSWYEFIQTSAGMATIAEEVRVLANPDNYPILVHCSAGRDRTGTLVILLSALVGVDKNDIMRDYEMTFFALTGGEVQAISDWVNASGRVLTFLDSYPGATLADKTESYLLKCGVTADEIASIRSILLEEDPPVESETHLAEGHE